MVVSIPGVIFISISFGEADTFLPKTEMDARAMKCMGLSQGYTCISANPFDQDFVTFGSQPWSLLKRHWNPFLISDADDRNSYGENRKYPTKDIFCGSMPIMACAFVLC